MQNQNPNPKLIPKPKPKPYTAIPGGDPDGQFTSSAAEGGEGGEGEGGEGEGGEGECAAQPEGAGEGAAPSPFETLLQTLAPPAAPRARPALIPPDARFPRAQGSSGATATVPFVWRGHTKSRTARAGRALELALRLG